ncbi:hypothetical protein PRNP1_010541 [Phytophthora ramorum]
MKFLLSVTVLVFAMTMALTAAQTSCGPRVRRNWDAMTDTEKTTYKGALAAAMDSGAYIKFVEIHTEMRSEMEAHRQCMFIYWHRLFLVVFENMLRGQGPEYACVTIPYFNWMEANSKMLSGECKTLSECSPIMKELGGLGGASKTVVIDGVKVTGSCASEAPLDHFCQSSSTTGTACAGCIPRGDWEAVKVPASTSYASVLGQVFNGTDIGQVSRAVERGCHSEVHSALGSTMAKFQSPADPIFWSHHAMLDVLLTIFHKCRVGTRRMTFEEKAADPVAWSSCKRRAGTGSGVPFKPTDVVTMRTGENGLDPIDGSKDPLIGQYFAGVPNRFADLTDVSDLGNNSYTYEISGLLATMYSTCGGTKITDIKTPAPAASTASPSPTPTTNVPTSAAPTTASPSHMTNTPRPVPVAPATTPALAGDRSIKAQATGIRSFFGWLFGTFVNKPGARRRLSSCRTTTTQKRAHKPSTPVPTDGLRHNDLVIATNLSRSEQRVMNWYNASIASSGGSSIENIADMERQVCMFQDQCLGGIIGYTEEFKSLWGVTEPRCRTIVNAINSGEQEIADAEWKKKMEAHFGCPQPANEAAS